MGGFFDRVGGFFRRGGGVGNEVPRDVDPEGPQIDDNGLLMAALVIGAILLVRR